MNIVINRLDKKKMRGNISTSILDNLSLLIFFVQGIVRQDGVLYHGDIRVIADKGKYDDKALIELNKHGNNNIDLDAIKWLAEQEEPRIWVTDLQVVGVYDKSHEIETGAAENLNNEGRAEISRFMKKHNIIPIEKFEYVKEFATQYANYIG